MTITEPVDPPLVTPHLVRPRCGRVVGGVAAGIGAYLGIDPIILRAGFVVLSLAGGSGVALYGLGWLVIPEEGSRRSPGADLLDRIQRHDRLPVAALVVAMVCGLLLLGSVTRPFPEGSGLWLPLGVVGLVALVAARDHRSTDRMPGVGPWWLWTLGGVLVILGGAELVLGWWWGWVAIGVLLTGGMALALAGRRWLAAGALLVILAATAGGAAWQRGVGDRTFQPDATMTGHRSYHLGVGRLTVDLTAFKPEPGRQADVTASVGVGKLVIVVPAGASARVDGSAGIGDVILLGRRSGGAGVRSIGGTSGSDGSLRVHTKVGIGEVLVESQPTAGG